MERNKGYRGGNDLFVCFPSRMMPKSTSNASSHSPARTDRLKETSRWRRKGAGQSSPMFNFPTLSRRNCRSRKSSEKLTEVAEEPTSPKVTCIGQVRVKSKKDGIRSKSGRKWGHMHELRKDVCGVFKGIGSEFSCALPCGEQTRTSPTASRSEHRKQHSSASRNTMLARVFMVLQDEDEKPGVKGKLEQQERKCDERDDNSMRLEDPFLRAKSPFGEIEDPFEENRDKLRRNLRRFRDDDDDEEDWYDRRHNHDGVGVEDVEEETSVPPRNVLLLMRCRSEPVRLSLDSDLWVNTPKADEPRDKKTCIVESDSKDSSEGTVTNYEDQDEYSSSIDVEAVEAPVGDRISGVERSQETGQDLTNGLFLMQCEPELTKLSLEISKETWVSNGELFRKSNVSQDNSRRLSKESTSTEEEEGSKAGRTEIPEEKLCPPKNFGLTRSKSNPLKVSVKLAPEASLWKRRSLGKPLSHKI